MFNVMQSLDKISTSEQLTFSNICSEVASHLLCLSFDMYNEGYILKTHVRVHRMTSENFEVDSCDICCLHLCSVRKTRTCIHTPGHPPMIPNELTESNLLAALDGAKLVYFDGRLHDTALVVAQEVIPCDLFLRFF